METNNSTYTLPHDNPEITPLISLAANMSAQAQCAENSLESILQIFDKSAATRSDDKEPFNKSINLSAESVHSAIEAALKARLAEAEALSSALGCAENILQKQQNHIQVLENDIRALYRHEEILRNNLVDSNAASAYDPDNPESQILLDTLEKARNRTQQLELCQSKVVENRENIEYIKARQIVTQTKIDDLQDRWLIIQEKINITSHPNELSAEQSAITEEKQPPPKRRFRSKKDTNIDNAEDEPQPQKKRSVVWAYVKVLLVALLLAFVIRAYVFDITKVEGLSMYPTLADNDNLITSKITYLLSEPERGDIIVFDAPDTAGEDYVKRIIGLPNEEITIERGMVYINGELLDEPYLNGVYTEGDIKMVIPDGFYFVMGDNRDISRDSRISDVGVISIDQIHGKVVFRIFPFDRFGSVYE